MRFSTNLATGVLESKTRPLAILIPLLLFLPGLSGAGVAQLVEHLICNQRVGGSIPSASSTRNFQGSEGGANPDRENERAGVSRHESFLCFFVGVLQLLEGRVRDL